MTPQFLDRVRSRLAESAGALTPDVIATAVRAESSGVLGDFEVLGALRTLHTEMQGAGILDPLLADRAVTDVLVLGDGSVWVDAGHGVQRATPSFPDAASVRRFAQRLALRAGRRLDDAQPFADGWLPGLAGSDAGVRLHAVLPPVAVDGPCVSLRVLRPAAHTLADLGARGAVPDDAMPLLRGIVEARLSFLVTGGTGSGKTTLLAALLGCVKPTERIVCVEDAAELAPRHPQLVRLAARAANVEGAGTVSLRDLVRQALRMRPDRIVVGEVRGAEVIDLLAALNTGHDGSAGTVHANSPRELPARLEALAALGGIEPFALHSQLAAALRVVLHVARDRTGRRSLTEIALLDPPCSGRVAARTCWSTAEGNVPGFGELRTLIHSRGAPT
ncbi:TadA family conjugal transfer-associated ATPase [Hoyosella sp. YIM 151337]|uniref:TadA family conjugal transfer-associated ATPase n=1 Tax=Hoyosella sp. YIM 151337 TaxID=2992742 RepID=UPI0022367562|nr:TadA family conjugal transfer-associated ATPase [Hoyosella sp. YIM 151337]MCW4352722.1 TadA family conjugal transfer-associated ATPase [Hoyosella sp. YIM 151337]